MRFTAIDDSNREDHVELSNEDQCAFLIAYTDRQFNPVTRQHKLIWDLKVKPTETVEWKVRKKKSAIRQFAAILSSALNKDWLRTGTIVPVPCSKAVDHPDYDRRLVEVCSSIDVGFAIDVREMVTQIVSTEAAHVVLRRPKIDDLLAIYKLDQAKLSPEPSAIAIFDDMLTNGTHFKAMKQLLSEKFPGVPISGLFLARREIHRILPDEFF